MLTNATPAIETVTVAAAADATPTPAAAKPAAKRAAKPKAAKPAKPVAAKPAAKPAAPKADASVEAERVAKLRSLAAKYYAGASIAAHQRKPAKADDYSSRITTPVQRIAGNGPSLRDESGLALIASGANASGTFDPVALMLDLGIASRLASIGFLALDKAGKPTLTKAGRERANIVIKRAA